MKTLLTSAGVVAGVAFYDAALVALVAGAALIALAIVSRPRVQRVRVRR